MSQIDETKPISQLTENENNIEKNNPKNNLDNIIIRTMPKKFKISSEAGDGKTKIVGAIIMIVGAFILVALVYLAYIYLINPKPKTAVNKEPSPIEKEIKEETPKPKEIEKEEIPIEEVKREPIASEPKETSTTTLDVSTSTEDILSTTTIIEDTTEDKTIDTDGDGLSDKEEEIFGSNISMSDSDSDGYEDLAELGNLYNPAGAGAIRDNQNIKQYDNSFYNYSVLRPATWLKQDATDGSSVIFGAIDSSFIQIISQSNNQAEDIKTWYQSQFPEKNIIDADIIVKNNWQGIFHENNKILYLTDNNKKYIFVISYVPEPENSMNYYNIFKMIINSFDIK